MKLLDAIINRWDDRRTRKKNAERLARACDGDDPQRDRFRAMTVREAERAGKKK